MSKNTKWVLVHLSTDKTTLTVEHGDDFLKRETDEAMQGFYRVLSALSERSSLISSEEDEIALRTRFRTAISMFEKSFRSSS